MTVAPPFFLVGVIIALALLALVIAIGGGTLWLAGYIYPEFKIKKPIKITIQAFFLAVGIHVFLLILQAPVIIALQTSLFDVPFLLLLFIASFIVYLIKVQFDGANYKRLLLSFILATFTCSVIYFAKELMIVVFKNLAST